MMMKLRPFELTLVTGFGLLAVVAMAMLALYKPPAQDGALGAIGKVSIWGTLPAEPVMTLLSALGENSPAFFGVEYRFVPSDSFDQELVRALADRTGPDLILVSHEELAAQRTRIAPMSYDTMSLRDVRTRYIDAVEVFALRDGLYAVPLGIDPLVLYWNRNLLQNVGLLRAPATWEELVTTMLPKLTVRDFDRTIRQSTVAFGEYANIKNFHGIISALIIQAGSRLVTENEQGYVVALNQSVAMGTEPLTSSLDFFMRFSNPVDTGYTWNRAQPLDRDAFVREQLALYFGYGTEARDIGVRNPNLNYDIAEIPQGAAATLRRTYGKVYGYSFVRNANNPAGAAAVLRVLAQPQNLQRLAADFGLAPAERTALALGSNDVFGRIIFEATPHVRAWVSPAPARLAPVWERMVLSASIDRQNIRGAANDAITRMGTQY